MVDYSDANRVAISYEVESTWGEDPDSTSQKLNYVSESLKGETGSSRSATIRDDRQTPYINRNSLRANGDINFEFQVDAYDDLFEGLLMADAAFGAETVVEAADTNISFTAPATISTTGTWDNEPDDGSWIVVQGSASNDQIYRVTTATTNSISISQGTVVSESAGESIVIKQFDDEAQGVTAKSFYIRKSFLDLNSSGDVAAGYPGMMVDGFTLNVSADSEVTSSFSFLGQKEASLTDGPDSGFTAASTDAVANGIDNVKRALIGAFEMDVSSISMTVKNNLRERLKVGTLGAFSIGMGTFEVSGTMNVYFETTNALAVFNANQSWADPALYIGIDDGTSCIVFEVPNIKIVSAQRLSTGINTDVMIELGWEAFIGPTSNAETLIIHKGSSPDA